MSLAKVAALSIDLYKLDWDGNWSAIATGLFRASYPLAISSGSVSALNDGDRDQIQLNRKKGGTGHPFLSGKIRKDAREFFQTRFEFFTSRRVSLEQTATGLSLSGPAAQIAC